MNPSAFVLLLGLASCGFGATTDGVDGEPLAGCAVTDGDTIHCGDEKIRLLGIDAPETRGCRPGRRCAPGDGQASTRSLEQAMNGGALTIIRLGTDDYGRTLALVAAGGRDLSCHQLKAGQAIYREDWDNGRAVAGRCPQAARAASAR